MQCKDIPDDAVLAAIDRIKIRRDLMNLGASRWDLAAELQVPEKIMLAKLKVLIRNGKIDGCGCGCRGDFNVRVDSKEASIEKNQTSS